MSSLLLCAVAMLAGLAAAAGGAAAAPDPAPSDGASGQYAVPPPPFSSDGIFPCSGCHADMDVDLERRELTDFHEDIRLHHGTRERWCFDCHHPDDRDHLRLAGGERVPFTESYRLCGQCHGDKYRDWRVGVHGKRTGRWDGSKQYLLCAHCHDPHAPRFAPIEPLPPPVRPGAVKAEEAEVAAPAPPADGHERRGEGNEMP